MRPELTVRETLELYAGYYREPRPVADTIDHSDSRRRRTLARGACQAASSAGSTSAWR